MRYCRHDRRLHPESARFLRSLRYPDFPAHHRPPTTHPRCSAAGRTVHLSVSVRTSSSPSSKAAHTGTGLGRPSLLNVVSNTYLASQISLRHQRQLLCHRHTPLGFYRVRGTTLAPARWRGSYRRACVNVPPRIWSERNPGVRSAADDRTAHVRALSVV